MYEIDSDVNVYEIEFISLNPCEKYILRVIMFHDQDTPKKQWKSFLGK